MGWADALGKRNDLAEPADERRPRLEAASVAGLGAVDARVAFAQNKIDQILEVYPSGYVSTGPDGQVFPVFGKPGGDGGVFLENGLGSRRLTAEGILTRDVSPHHQLTFGLTLGREGTHELKANANLDFRTGFPVSAAPDGTLGPLTAAVADSHRSIVSVFAQEAWTPSPRLSLTAGLRFDDYWGVGGIVSPRLALVGNLPSWLERKLPAGVASGLGYKLLYGRSFRMPTFSRALLQPSRLHRQLPTSSRWSRTASKPASTTRAPASGRGRNRLLEPGGPDHRDR